MPLLPDAAILPDVVQLYLPVPKAEDGSPLPLEQQAWVKIDLRPVDGADMSQGINDTNPFGQWLSRRIVDWNFVDESGAKLPITYENSVRIGAENIGFLARQPLRAIPAIDTDQKKTSSFI